MPWLNNFFLTFCSSERLISTDFLNQARAWFLKITSVRMYVCVSAPRATYQTSPTAFQFLCMVLAIDTVDGRGLSYEAHRVLLPKKSKVTLYLPFITL